ncbi:MAG: hypothetical protein NZZ41_00805 [Candidatus Dojkabacteria bacterium]|nr:hypothetical protein [Candidatus Dojkabacteria bacterium]
MRKISMIKDTRSIESYHYIHKKYYENLIKMKIIIENVIKETKIIDYMQ